MYRQAYNAQAAVDAGGSQLIVSARIGQCASDRNDLVADVAGHNLSLLMRQLIGAGTPREAVAGGYGGIFVLLTPTGAMLVARGVSQSRQTAFAAAFLIWE